MSTAGTFVRKRLPRASALGSRKAWPLAAAAAGMALGLPLLGVVGPSLARASAQPPACTDTWNNSSGGDWDTGTNWSSGAAPGTSDVACITATGTYTVTIGNETINVAGLEVGGSGSTPSLQIGNGGSHYPDITVTGEVDIASGSTLSYGWGGSFTAATVNNTGTFTVPSSSFSSDVDVTTFTSTGNFTVDASLEYSLPTTGSEFTNDGTLTVASSQTLAFSSPSGQTGTLDQDGQISMGSSASLTVADELEISGGTICGGTPYIGSGDGGTGGTLSFDPTVGTGPACGSGVAQDSVFFPNATSNLDGTIPKGYTVSIGDGGSSYAHVTLNSVTNKGTVSFGWGGTLTGPLTNASTGKFVVPNTTYASSWTTTSITNSGQFTVNSELSVSLSSTGDTFTNSGTVSITSTGQLAVSSPSGQTGTFDQNSGSLTNLGSTNVADTLDIAGGTVCGNAVYSGSGDGGTGGTLEFAASPPGGPACASGQATDQIFIPNVTGTISTNIPAHWTVTIGDGGSSFAHVTMSGTTNAGNLDPGFGATLTVSGTLTNTGTITVPSSTYTTQLDLGGLANNGKVTFNAPTDLNLGGGTFSTEASKKVKIGKGVTVTLDGSYASAGTLTMKSGGVMTVSGAASQTGTLAVQIGSSSSTVRVQASGVATVGGTIDVTNKNFTPSSGEHFTLLTGSSLTGTFSTVQGSYSISYTATSVVATAPS